MQVEIPKNSPCPCGSGRQYEICCYPLHQGEAAATPESLMRSRFSAISLGNMAYMNSTCSEELAAPVGSSADGVEWLALHVLGVKPKPYGDRAWVEFVAFYVSDGRVHQLHEKSWFEQPCGRWIYVSGDIRPDVRWGRNDPCWCGSGKKTKKCHA